VIHFDPALSEYGLAISAALDAGLLTRHRALRRKALGLGGIESQLNCVNLTAGRVQATLVFRET